VLCKTFGPDKNGSVEHEHDIVVRVEPHSDVRVYGDASLHSLANDDKLSVEIKCNVRADSPLRHTSNEDVFDAEALCITVKHDDGTTEMIYLGRLATLRDLRARVRGSKVLYFVHKGRRLEEGEELRGLGEWPMVYARVKNNTIALIVTELNGYAQTRFFHASSTLKTLRDRYGEGKKVDVLVKRGDDMVRLEHGQTHLTTVLRDYDRVFIQLRDDPGKGEFDTIILR
jgi:hypothetical protein